MSRKITILTKSPFLLLLLCAVFVMAHPNNKKIVSYNIISMAAAESTATGQITIGNMLNYSKILGEIIIDSSLSRDGGFGTIDTFRVALRTEIDRISYLVDSTQCVGLPCTLSYSDSAWTVMGERLYMDWYWNDSTSVAADSTFSIIVRILLKLFE